MLLKKAVGNKDYRMAPWSLSPSSGEEGWGDFHELARIFRAIRSVGFQWSVSQAFRSARGIVVTRI